MSIKPDEFEATRQVVATLEPFDNADRERILRWARDKLGMPTPTGDSAAFVHGAHGSLGPVGPTAPRPEPASDIRSFIEAKNPRTDTQLAAVVAYFHRFVAPGTGRKDAVGKEDLLNACRLADRSRPKRPDQTLVNAFGAGYFDKAGRGFYKLNSVGENLVAVALPGAPEGDTGGSAKPRAGRPGRKGSRKTPRAKQGRRTPRR